MAFEVRNEFLSVDQKTPNAHVYMQEFKAVQRIEDLRKKIKLKRNVKHDYFSET